jgi:hypothetical protein
MSLVRTHVRRTPALLALVLTRAAFADPVAPKQAVIESGVCTMAGTAAAATLALVFLPRTSDSQTLVDISVGAGALGVTSLVLCPSVGRMHTGLAAGPFLATRALTLLSGAALVASIALAGGVYGAIGAGLIVGPLTGLALVAEGLYDMATTPKDMAATMAPLVSARGVAFAVHF